MTRAKTDRSKSRATKAAPGPRTSAALAQAQEKQEGLPVRPFLELDEGSDGLPQLVSPHSDEAGHSAWLKATLGTSSSSFFTDQINALEIATRSRSAGNAPNQQGVNAALALIGAISPEDELEGALATQMVGCHALTMEMLCRAKTTGDLDQLQIYGNMAVKLQRTFTTQIETLARMRGKGQQTVRVEHVTVHPGGQAIVGDVHHHPQGAPGAQTRTEDQPHETAPAATSPEGCPALPCPDAQGNGVPVPGHAKRPMPTPRRTVARRPRQPERVQARALESRDDRDASGTSDNAT